MGSIVDGITGLFGGSSADRNQHNSADNAGAALGNESGLASQYGSAFGSAFPGTLGAFMGQSGFGANGAYNQSFDPYATTGNSIIGQYSDKVAPGYNNAVTAAQHDLLQRGMTGANSIAPSEIGDIRRTQASDVANFGRSLGVQSQQERYSRLQAALQAILGVGGSAMQGFGNTASGEQGLGQTWGGIGAGQTQNLFGLASLFG